MCLEAAGEGGQEVANLVSLLGVDFMDDLEPLDTQLPPALNHVKVEMKRAPLQGLRVNEKLVKPFGGKILVWQQGADWLLVSLPVAWAAWLFILVGS